MTASQVPYEYSSGVEECEDRDRILPLTGIKPMNSGSGVLRSNPRPWHIFAGKIFDVDYIPIDN